EGQIAKRRIFPSSCRGVSEPSTNVSTASWVISWEPGWSQQRDLLFELFACLFEAALGIFQRPLRLLPPRLPGCARVGALLPRQCLPSRNAPWLRACPSPSDLPAWRLFS